MLASIRRWFASSSIFAFNPVLRDRWVAAQAKSVPKGKRVLDAGAGSCPYRSLFAHCEYRTQDAQPLEADQLRFGAYGAIDYLCDLASIPVEDASFDVILCTEVLEHHPRPIEVICEFARILSPGGKLLLTAPLGSGIHQEPYHFYGGYTPFWYKKFLAEAGFMSIEVVANEGSIRFFSQEGIRFLRATGPQVSSIPIGWRLAWLPFWLTLLPLLGIIVPLASTILDRFDRDQRFTVGYHVKAIRSPNRDS